MHRLYLISLALCFATAAHASDIVMYPKKAAEAPTVDYSVTSIDDAAQKARFVIFADGDHLDVSTFGFFTREDTLKKLSNAGVRHIFVEMLNTVAEDNDIQEMIDAYAREPEKMAERREELVTTIATVVEKKYFAGYESLATQRGTTIAALAKTYGESFATLLEHATTLGMRVHCADNMSFATQSPALHAFLADVQQGLPPGYTLEQALQSAPELMAEYQQIIMTARLDDTALAQHIRRTTGPEKAAIYYGVLHGNRAGDLDELLGKDQTRTIELHKSGKAYTTHLVSGKACGDLPGVVFQIDENMWVTPRKPPVDSPSCKMGTVAVK